MKIIPVLAITNALALALAVFLYMQQGELKSQVGTRRSDSGENARLAARVDTLERELERALAMRGLEPAPVAAVEGASARIAPAETAARREGDAPPLAAPAPGDPEGPGSAGAASAEYDPQEMEVFRHKVKTAIDLNAEEEQKNRVIEQIDELVKQNKIAPLNARQKEGVATAVLSYRKKIPEVWQRIRASGALENASREDRGRMVRAEYEALRNETQHALEEIIPAADAKTYLDETMRDQMRGAGAWFGGGPPPPSPPNPGR